MNLLLAADIFPPQSGGPATYVVTLANALVARGMSVRIVSLNPQSDKLAVSCHPPCQPAGVAGLFAVSFRNKFLRYLEYLWLLIREAKRADVVYAMGPVNAGVPALVAAWLFRKPLVLKVVGDYAWEQGVQRFGVPVDIDTFQEQRFGGLVGLLRAAQSLVVRRAVRVIVPCRYLKTLVEEWGAAAKQICVVYNAPQTTRTVVARKPADEEWIISAGRLVPWKGMAALIDVVAELRDARPALRLKIVGDGPERHTLEKRIHNLRVEDRVELLGALPHEKTLSFIAAADLFVLNSRYEGLSHVLLEAMALQVPVIASNVGGNPEIIAKTRLFSADARNEIREKILTLLAHPEPSVLGDAFSREKMIERTEEILTAVCQKSS